VANGKIVTDSYFTPDVHSSPLVTDDDREFNLTMSFSNPGKLPESSSADTNGPSLRHVDKNIISIEPPKQSDLQVRPTI
jgi:hypothetical protein